MLIRFIKQKCTVTVIFLLYFTVLTITGNIKQVQNFHQTKENESNFSRIKSRDDSLGVIRTFLFYRLQYNFLSHLVVFLKLNFGLKFRSVLF